VIGLKEMARRGELKLSILSASDSLEDDAGDVKTRAQLRCWRFALTRKTVLASSFAVSLVVAAVVVCSVMLPPLFNRPPPPSAPPPASIRLLVVGDSGVGDQMQIDVARQMSMYASRQGVPFDALLHVGDVVYFDGDPQLFHDRITVPYLSPLQARKFLIALGNHDTKWSDGGASMLEFVNLSSRYYEHIFTRSTGVSVQLIVLDSNSLAYWWRNPGALNQTFTAEQASFLDAKLAHGSFTWRVVSFHHPVYSCASHKSTPNVSTEWLPIIARRGNVDLVLSGHDHK
jgi:hypothetical protein